MEGVSFRPWPCSPTRAQVSIARDAWRRLLFVQHRNRIFESRVSNFPGKSEMPAVNKAAWASAFEEAKVRALEGMPE